MNNDIIEILSFQTKNEKTIPYYHDASGALWYDDDGKAKLISEVYIKATTLSRGSDGTSWASIIEFKDLDNKLKNIQIPCKTLLDSKETFKLLVDSGFKASCCRTPLIKYLQDVEPEKRLIQLTRSGWVANGLEYVCQSFKITDSTEEYVLPPNDSIGLSKRGTLAEWQEHVCQYCVDNHVLTLALCVGLSGILLRFLPSINTTMVNLVGKSSIGKTTALQVASSLWGDSKFIKQWRCTSNALEAIAESYNDGLLILDELGQVNGKDVSNITYMLGNEKGKGRMNADSSLRYSKSWRLAILSSGEIGIASKMEEAGIKAKGGQLVRCIDIDACVSELGIYNCLHGARDGAELSNILKENCSKYYGVVAEEFIRRLTRDISHEELRNSVNTEVSNEYERIVTKFQLEKADGQVERVAKSFASWAASGLFAVRLEVVVQNEEQIRKSIDYKFSRWLQDRGGVGSFEEQDIVDALKGFLLQNSSRFKDMNCLDQKPINNCLGYKTQQEKKTLYHMIPKLFQREFSTNYMGVNHKIVRQILSKEGILETYEDGRDRYIQYADGSRGRMTTIIF